MVSIDQFISNFPGRLPNAYGREKEYHRYVGGTILCTSLLYISLFAVQFHLVLLRIPDPKMPLKGRQFEMVFPFIIIDDIM